MVVDCGDVRVVGGFTVTTDVSGVFVVDGVGYVTLLEAVVVGRLSLV